jgi:hypothetical protein
MLDVHLMPPDHAATGVASFAGSALTGAFAGLVFGLAFGAGFAATFFGGLLALTLPTLPVARDQ